MTDGPRFELTLVTRDPVWAEAADRAGVDFVGVDIERLGKSERQARIANARISDHRLEDLDALRPVLRGAVPWVRLNPLHARSRAEIDAALAAGARALTLPQFRSAAELHEFSGLVGGRALVIPLLEDVAAADDLDAILPACGGRMMVGLNDLSRSMGLSHPLQLATHPLLDEIGHGARAAGVAWGFGGVTDPAPRPDLPVDPDDLLSRYADTGATGAWVSRSMIAATRPQDLARKIAALRLRIAQWQEAGPDARAEARERVSGQIARALRGG